MRIAAASGASSRRPATGRRSWSRRTPVRTARSGGDLSAYDSADGRARLCRCRAELRSRRHRDQSRRHPGGRRRRPGRRRRGARRAYRGVRRAAPAAAAGRRAESVRDGRAALPRHRPACRRFRGGRHPDRRPSTRLTLIKTIDGRASSSEGELDVSPDGTRVLSLDADGRDDAVGSQRPAAHVGRSLPNVSCNRPLPRSAPGSCCVPIRSVASSRSISRPASQPVPGSTSSRVSSRSSALSDRRPHARRNRWVEHRVVAARRFRPHHPRRRPVPGESAVGYDVDRARRCSVGKGDRRPRAQSARRQQHRRRRRVHQRGVVGIAGRDRAASSADGTGGLYDVVRHRRIPGTTVHLDIAPLLAMADAVRRPPHHLR